MNPAVLSMLDRYKCVTKADYENALKEIIQEIALLGLWRAKFFEHAAFYGGTALRILYGLDRFSEDLDFSLLEPRRAFNLAPYFGAIEAELNGMGFSVAVTRRSKKAETAVESAFIKAGTKEHLLKIQVPDPIADRAHVDASLQIKVEVDTDPPGGFETEARTLLQPIPFSVNTYRQPDLFAGKLHAILQRNWKTRVKGRDYYDFVWYVARDLPVHLSHLEQRLRQSGGWTGKKPLQRTDLLKLLDERFSGLNVEAAKSDVMPFLRDPQAADVWSRDFFKSLLPRLKADA
jgi:predicted nucleotidyltransferase component of viral defense system